MASAEQNQWGIEMSWIKMRTLLETDGRVRKMSASLSAKCPHVLGQLFRFWCLGDRHCDENGVLFGWDSEAVDGYLNEPGFCNAMPSDWIDLRGEWVKLPEYQEHNGSTAKRRASDSKRKSESRKADIHVRKMSASKADSSSLISSNKDKKKGQADPYIVFPSVLDTPEVRKAWAEWRGHKTAIKDAYKNIRSEEYQLERWQDKQPAVFIAAIHYSIAQGWKGIFEDPDFNKAGASPLNGVQPRPNHGAFKIFTAADAPQREAEPDPRLAAILRSAFPQKAQEPDEAA